MLQVFELLQRLPAMPADVAARLFLACQLDPSGTSLQKFLRFMLTGSDRFVTLRPRKLNFLLVGN